MHLCTFLQDLQLLYNVLVWVTREVNCNDIDLNKDYGNRGFDEYFADSIVNLSLEIPTVWNSKN